MRRRLGPLDWLAIGYVYGRLAELLVRRTRR